MAWSHITKLPTHKHKEPVTTELLDKVSNAPGVTCKHNVDQGHHNRSDTQSTTSVHCKLVTRKDESFSSDTVKNRDFAKTIWGTLNMVAGFLNDMVLETSHMDAPTLVKNNNEKLLQWVNQGRPSLSLYMKTTMVLWDSLTLDWNPTKPLVPTSWKKGRMVLRVGWQLWRVEWLLLYTYKREWTG